MKLVLSLSLNEGCGKVIRGRERSVFFFLNIFKVSLYSFGGENNVKQWIRTFQ